MKRGKGISLVLVLTFSFLLLSATPAISQCSICTRTAEQLGEKPAKGMNAGILYLAFAPLALIGFLTYRWVKANKR